MNLAELMTVDEVAEQLKVHPESVRRWLRDGRLTGYRISRRSGWRIRPDAVQKMLETGTEEFTTKKLVA
jgi:excisionase family DNA binding protein